MVVVVVVVVVAAIVVVSSPHGSKATRCMFGVVFSLKNDLYTCMYVYKLIHMYMSPLQDTKLSMYVALFSKETAVCHGVKK